MLTKIMDLKVGQSFKRTTSDDIMVVKEIRTSYHPRTKQPNHTDIKVYNQTKDIDDKYGVDPNYKVNLLD